MTQPQISVVVPARDRAASIVDLLQALDAQTLSRERFEVILVDDRSTDQTPELISAWVEADTQRRRLLYGEGVGPAAARNLGIRETRGKWVAFTDSDTIPDPDWLEAALELVEKGAVHALEGAVEPWPPEAVDSYTHQIDSADGGRYMTANMIYRRELLESLGGFDERFEAAFLEDSDLAFRVLDAGFEILYAPEVRVRHRVEQRSLIDVHRSARKVRWIALLAAKHPERYRSELRPIMRPLSHVDLDVLIGLLAAAAAPKAKGLARAVLVVSAANGIRRGLGSGQVLAAPREQVLARTALSLSLPVSKAFWWLEGTIRFRKFVW